MKEQQQKILEDNDEVPNEDVEIRRLIEERRNTTRGEKQHLKEVSKQVRKCIRDKKRSKRQEKIQRILEEFRGIKNIQGGQLTLGPFRLSKLGIDPVLATSFRSEWAPLGGPGDRNFGPGP